MHIDGGLHAQTIRLEGDVVSRDVGFGGIIAGGARTQWTGYGIEHSFAGELGGVDSCVAGRGTAAGAGKLAGLPRPTLDLAILKRYAGRALRMPAGVAIVAMVALQRDSAGIKLSNSSTSRWPVMPTA